MRSIGDKSIRVLAVTAAFLICCCAHAVITGPYIVDSNTLHLWHLDQPDAPAIDSVVGGTNLTALANGATLGNRSFPGFGTALRTASNTNAYLAPRALVNGAGDDTIMSYADAETGAFTYEALVRVDFDPATNFSRTLPLYILTGENDGAQPNSARAFQFRIMPNGATLAGTSPTDYRLHYFNTKDNGSYFAVIPLVGPNALAVGNWYHVAVTYNGNDATEGNTKLYWTRLAPDNTEANELPGTALVAMTDLSTTATPDFAIGNVGRTTPNSSWPGLIDEVRISKTARLAMDMMFSPVEVTILASPENQTIPVGQSLNLNVSAFGKAPLSYQWRFNGVPISGATNRDFSIAVSQSSDAGIYDAVVSNSTSSATSAPATVLVISQEPVSLRCEQVGQDVILTWPASAAGLVLQTASNLVPVIQWKTLTNMPVIQGNEFIVSLSKLGAQQFFRLAGATNFVRPVDWTLFQAGMPGDTNAQMVRAILLNACKYAMTTWWDTARNYDAQDATDYLSFGGISESNIRSPAMEAYGLAVALKTGVYDAAYIGVPMDDARNRTLKLVRSLAFRHRTNQTNGWGNDWQTAHWAALTGTAGWMLWPELSATDQDNLRRMVEYEANRFVNYAVPYFMNRAGVILYPGDSKSEENAWNASVLHLAICMMPEHPNVSVWWNKAIEMTLSTYARPSDINRTNAYHGRSLASWLNGSNANEDGTLFNHNFMHPDYIASGLSEFQPALVYMLAHKPVPKAGLFNLDLAYHAMVEINFVAGTTPYPIGGAIQSPGGYVYVRDGSSLPSGDVYYPQGNDWGTMRRMHFANMDATVHAFDLDGLVSIQGSNWEFLHDLSILSMQARFTDGRTYGAQTEDTYGLREEWVCNFAAKCYLMKWLVHQGQLRRSNDAFSDFFQ